MESFEGRDERKGDAMIDLEALRVPLQGQMKMGHSSSDMAQKMLTLIDAIQEAHKQSVFYEGLYEFIDAPLSMTEYVYVQQHLMQAARQIAAACRKIINQPQDSDKDLLKEL
jgi:hypothetical protein